MGRGQKDGRIFSKGGGGGCCSMRCDRSCKSASLHSSLCSLRVAELVQLLQFCVLGCVGVLHQVFVAAGYAPCVGGGHRGAEGAAAGGLQVLPVLTTSPIDQTNKIWMI